MISKKSKRQLWWLLMNGVFFGCLCLGYFWGVEGARSVAVFGAYALFVLSLFMFSDEVVKEMANMGRCVPAWMDVTVDLAVVFIFVWHGATYVGALYFAHLIIQTGAWSRAEKLQA